ncbi:galactokinase [Meridianimaribacter flavus]|uniref:Galactokinase n=1 Tax=Meridianimaribacter flavus TaxID=571115 RepID=A0ABY2G7Z2_9FLAO|nr:galactokinase [Meridianimaribacter flavus]TDY13910.1 galactokinase [Meridianimaribacter flavus]
MNPKLTAEIVKRFQDKFKTQPLVLHSPGRINLIGEHTDYNEGFVFPAAINKGIVGAIQKAEKPYCTVIANDLDEEYEFSLNTIKPIANGQWRNFVVGVVGELQKRGVELEPFNFVFGGDIPKGAGLSSSAALENSVIFGLNELFNLGLSKKEMIEISQKAEHNYVGVRCGIMDQYASMFGEKDRALLLDCRTLKAKTYPLEFKDYQVMLINTNVSHNLVDAEYNDRRDVCEKVAKLLSVNFLRDATEAMLNSIKYQLSEDEYQKALYIIQENERVLKAGKMLEEKNVLGFGKLLFEAHYGAQHQFKISCKELDFLVDEARNNPLVIGARMMGGGFGGCTINFVKTEAVKSFSDDISKKYRKTFKKECSIYFVKLSQGTHFTNN